MCAFAEAQNKFPKETVDTDKKLATADIVMLSLGTGIFPKDCPYKNVRGWGWGLWSQYLIDIMMNGVSETTDFQLQQLYGAAGRKDQYLRVNPVLQVPMELDDVSKIATLKMLGEVTATEKSAELDKFVELLLATEETNNLSAR